WVTSRVRTTKDSSSLQWSSQTRLSLLARTRNWKASLRKSRKRRSRPSIRTRTTPNRTITSIMSLWARKKVGHLLMAGALLFLSCDEDITLLGYKADDRFGVHYWDIPLESSLLLIDSLRTSNLSQETQRLLMGRYTDDLLGEVNASFYTQYYRNGSLPDSLALAPFDSIALTLAFDDYFYGSPDATPQEIAIYELEEELANVLTEIPRYYNNSVKQLGAQIGSYTFTLDPVLLEDNIANRAANKKDSVYTVRMLLDPAFGQRLFEAAVRADNATTVEDSAFVKLDQFIKLFKGISVQA